MSPLERKIIKTIVWFDMFSYPLRAEELLWYLYDESGSESRLSDIQLDLDALVAVKRLQTQDELYFLPGRSALVDIRKERHKESLKKISLARSATLLLRFLPFVKSVIVCNVLGYLNAKPEDDIDFLIITSSNKIWTARWYATGFFKLLRLRPTKNQVADKFCFSFYVSTGGLDMKKIALPNDPYLAWWFSGLLPLYDQANYFNQLLEANQWVKKYLPNFMQRYSGGEINKYKVKNKFKCIKKIFENMNFDWCDKIYRHIQRRIMPTNLTSKIGTTNGVIVNDVILKFHLIDRRQDFLDSFSSKLKKILN